MASRFPICTARANSAASPRISTTAAATWRNARSSAACRRGAAAQKIRCPCPSTWNPEIEYTQGSGSSTVETDPAASRPRRTSTVGDPIRAWAARRRQGDAGLLTITNVEVVGDHETAGIGTPAIETTSAIVEANWPTSTSPQAHYRAAPSSTHSKRRPGKGRPVGHYSPNRGMHAPPSLYRVILPYPSFCDSAVSTACIQGGTAQTPTPPW